MMSNHNSEPRLVVHTNYHNGALENEKGRGPATAQTPPGRRPNPLLENNRNMRFDREWQKCAGGTPGAGQMHGQHQNEPPTPVQFGNPPRRRTPRRALGSNPPLVLWAPRTRSNWGPRCARKGCGRKPTLLWGPGHAPLGIQWQPRRNRHCRGRPAPDARSKALQNQGVGPPCRVGSGHAPCGGGPPNRNFTSHW